MERGGETAAFKSQTAPETAREREKDGNKRDGRLIYRHGKVVHQLGSSIEMSDGFLSERAAILPTVNANSLMLQAFSISIPERFSRVFVRGDLTRVG